MPSREGGLDGRHRLWVLWHGLYFSTDVYPLALCTTLVGSVPSLGFEVTASFISPEELLFPNCSLAESPMVSFRLW